MNFEPLHTKPKKVGLTGGIGSGKTVVCRIFEVLGVPVYYSDIEAKKLMHSDPGIKKALKARYGGAIYGKYGQLDRAALAGHLFHSDQERAFINGLVHPAVARHFEEWAAQQTAAFVVQESALLFESGADKKMDTTLMVYANEDLRIQRVSRRDGISGAEVKQRIRSQMPDEEKKQKADKIIYNNEDRMLIPQVVEVYKQL